MKNIYYKDGCWNYTAKEVDHNKLQINYVTRTGFASEEQALIAYQKAEKEYDKSMTRIKDITGVRFTFSTYLTYWFQFILQRYGGASYQSRTAWTIYNVILPVVEKDILLTSVSEDYINNILKKCNKYSMSAGSSARKVILLAMKDAAKDGIIRKMDVRFIDEYPENPPKVVLYTKEQIRMLLKAAEEYYNIYLEVLLAMFCGLRTGEILGLKYTDFDKSNHTVKIRRQITRDYDVYIEDGKKCKRLSSNRQSVKAPKTYNSYRTLRVPSIIFEELEKRKAENELYLSKNDYTREWEDYVCIGKYGRVKSVHTINSAINVICNRYSLPKITTHGLRHVFASILIEQDVPLEKLSKLLGHKNIKTTFEIYCGIVNAFEDTRQYVSENLDPAIYAVNRVGVTYAR